MIGEKAFYRSEREINPEKPLPDALEEIRWNTKLEKDVSEWNKSRVKGHLKIDAVNLTINL